MLAAAVFFARLRIERADYLRRLFTACCVITLSELYFTFYGDVTDINNLPGHLYNLIAYLLIYQALSVRGALEPYQRLQQSRQPRRPNLERRRTGLVSDWWRVGLSPDWYREQDGAAAQAMLAAIVENSNTAIIGCALDHTILSWNAAAERMFGWSANEAIGQPLAIITPQQHHGLLQPLFEQAARGEPVGQIESCYLRQDGTCIDTAGTLVAIRDANGDTVFFTLTLWDITQQKQLEREVRQKAALAELLEALAREANEAATPEAAMQSCLERICDYGHWMLGRVGIFAPGQSKDVPQSSLWHCPQPARFDEFMRISNTFDHTPPSGKFTNIALREKKPVWVSDFLAVSGLGRLARAAEFGIRSGFVFPVVVGGEVSAFLEFFAAEVRDADSAFIEAINSVASQLARVVERKRGDEALRRLNEKLDATLQAIPDLLFELDENGCYHEVWARDQSLLAAQRERLLGHTVTEMLPPEAAEAIFDALREAAGKGTSRGQNIRLLLPRGEFWFELSTARKTTNPGEVQRFIMLSRDITERKQAEQELLESQKQFQQLAEHIPQAFWITDMQRKELVYLSPAHEQIYGQRFSSLQSVWPAWREAIHAEDRERVLAAYREMGSRGLDERFRILQPDGAMRWVHARGVPVRDANGTVYRVVGTIEDITAAKESEMKIRIATERLQRALEGSNLALFDGDLRTRKVYLSEAWAAMLGEEPKPTIDTFEDLIKRVHPEETNQVNKAFYDVLKGQIPVYDLEHRVMSRTGEWIWIHSRAKVVERAEDGRALRLAGVNADITERVRSDEALRKSEQQLRAITANLPGAVFQFSISPAGEYSFPYLSEGILDLAEIRPEDAMRDHTLLFALIEPEHLPAVLASIERARTTLDPWSCEWPIRIKNCQTKWIRGRAIVARRDDGAVLGDGILIDITAEKQAEQEIGRLNQSLEQRVRERTRQLEATNKELEAFSYSVSHDLRAPLRGIDGFSQMLLKKYADHLDETGSDYLLRIRRASLRMGELIDDLLQLSRVSRSQIKIEPLDLSQLARSILAALQESEPERTVVTEVQDGIELSADPHLLKIVLENLLGNAWKFTAKQQPAIIRIGTQLQDGEPVVFVKDNGAGFDMKFAHKLFGAFQRLHGATEFEGTGIGLATVQRIMNLHGGRIWADAA